MSCSRHCAFYKATNGSWYMELAQEEYAGREDATTYGPFATQDAADEYLRDGFSNPGGSWSDDSGTAAVPTLSPNGQPVQNPRMARTQRRIILRF